MNLTCTLRIAKAAIVFSGRVLSLKTWQTRDFFLNRSNGAAIQYIIDNFNYFNIIIVVIIIIIIITVIIIVVVDCTLWLYFRFRSLLL